MGQVVDWCGKDFDGILVFDKCHQAKHCISIGSTESPQKTGFAILELQNKLPKARIFYISATGALEPHHISYMVRLGLWGQGTPFRGKKFFLQKGFIFLILFCFTAGFTSFIGTVAKSVVEGMEILAIEMKHHCMYIACQLSFKDVTFIVDEVALSPKFI